MRITEITMGKDSHRKDVGGRRSGDYHRDLSLDRSGFIRDKERSKPTDDLRNKLPGKSKSTKSRVDEDLQSKNDLRSKIPGKSRVTLSHLEEDLDEPKPNPKTPNLFNLKTMILNNEKHNNKNGIWFFALPIFTPISSYIIVCRKPRVMCLY